jgi:hypothetical protein
MSTTLTLYITTDPELSRYELLDRRDEITAALAPLGIRVSLTDEGTTVHLADAGANTVSDVLAGGGRWEPDLTCVRTPGEHLDAGTVWRDRADEHAHWTVGS